MFVSKLVALIPNLIEYDISSDCEVVGAELDSRSVAIGNIFFGVVGSHVDGNEYAQDALDKGAACAIVTDSSVYYSLVGNKFLVTDGIEALKVVGAERFKTCNAQKIAITGSFGKTSTKEMLKLVLSESHNVYATSGNQNNELGLSLTGAGIDDNAEYVIAELGANEVGEIEMLSSIVNPDVAVVVSIGAAHVGKFGGFDNIIQEKLSIIKGLKTGGTVVLPAEYKMQLDASDKNVITFGDSNADYYITNIENDGLQTVYSTNKSEQTFKINHPYRHMAVNSLAVIAVAKALNISDSDIANGLQKYAPLKMHGDIINVGELTIINDTYNAGLESILTAICALNNIENVEKYAVIGEMMEINGYEKELYSKIIELTDICRDITFILCGKQFAEYANTSNRNIYADKTSAMDKVLSINTGVMLVKAARAMRFDEIVTEIQNTNGDAHVI